MSATTEGLPATQRRVLLDVMLSEQVSYPLADFVGDGDARAVAKLLAEDHSSLASAISDLDLYVGSLYVQVQMPDGSFTRAEVVYDADHSVEVRDA